MRNESIRSFENLPIYVFLIFVIFHYFAKFTLFPSYETEAQNASQMYHICLLWMLRLRIRDIWLVSKTRLPLTYSNFLVLSPPRTTTRSRLSTIFSRYSRSLRRSSSWMISMSRTGFTSPSMCVTSSSSNIPATHKTHVDTYHEPDSRYPRCVSPPHLNYSCDNDTCHVIVLYRWYKWHVSTSICVGWLGHQCYLKMAKKPDKLILFKEGTSA